MKKFIARTIALLAGLAIGVGVRIVSAQGTVQTYTGNSGGNWGSIQEIIAAIIGFINKRVFPLLIAVAVLAFFWNMIHFISSGGNPAERKNFKKYSINAVIALFVLLAVWGIVGIVTRTFFGVDPFIPQLPTS